MFNRLSNLFKNTPTISGESGNAPPNKRSTEPTGNPITKTTDKSIAEPTGKSMKYIFGNARLFVSNTIQAHKNSSQDTRLRYGAREETTTTEGFVLISLFNNDQSNHNVDDTTTIYNMDDKETQNSAPHTHNSKQGECDSIENEPAGDMEKWLNEYNSNLETNESNNESMITYF